MLAKYDRDNRLFELVEGTLVEKAMGFYEGRLAAVLIHFIEEYLEQNDLGVAVAPNAMMRLAPGLVRMPDVSFVTWSRFPTREVPRDPIASLAPDLVVEVLSGSNTRAEMERKTREYFAAGARRVWLIDPGTETARAYTSPRRFTVVEKDGVLDGGDVLPGFQIKLAVLFQRASRGQGA